MKDVTPDLQRYPNTLLDEDVEDAEVVPMPPWWTWSRSDAIAVAVHDAAPWSRSRPRVICEKPR